MTPGLVPWGRYSAVIHRAWSRGILELDVTQREHTKSIAHFNPHIDFAPGTMQGQS